MPEKLIAANKRAGFDYFVLDKIEAGIELCGTEVKSLRTNGASFHHAYINISNGEAFLSGLHIKPYEQGNIWNTDPDRERKLLLHKSEIRKLSQSCKEQGMTVIPLSLYFKNGRVKLMTGLCKGKKLYDKREAIKERDLSRDKN